MNVESGLFYEPNTNITLDEQHIKMFVGHYLSEKMMKMQCKIKSFTLTERERVLMKAICCLASGRSFLIILKHYFSL